MKKTILASIVILLLIGCTGMAKHRRYIRDGVLFSGLNQFAFVKEWGVADKQGTWTEEGGQYRIAIGWRGGGVNVGGRRRAFNDVWVYYKQNKILFFSNYSLIAHNDWDEYQKMEREREELPSIMK
jgi:hypothetical protein